MHNYKEPFKSETGNLARGCLLYVVMFVICIAIIILFSIN